MGSLARWQQILTNSNISRYFEFKFSFINKKLLNFGKILAEMESPHSGENLATSPTFFNSQYFEIF